MSGVMGFIDGMFNLGRNAMLTEEERVGREATKQWVEIFKIANIVGAVVSVIFFAFFPNIFTFLYAGGNLLSAIDSHAVLNNISEMLNNARIEATARLSDENMVDQVSKNTLFFGPVIRLMTLAANHG